MLFDPMLTPKDMLHKGIFGGTYFNELIDYKEFPSDWFQDLDSRYYRSATYCRDVNYFGVKAGQSQRCGKKRGGYIKMTQGAGLNGTVNFTWEGGMKTINAKLKDGSLSVALTVAGETIYIRKFMLLVVE